MADSLDRAYAETFTTGWGSQVLDDLKDMFFDRVLFEPGDDQLTLAWREGQRHVIIQVLSSIERGLETDEEPPKESISSDEEIF